MRERQCERQDREGGKQPRSSRRLRRRAGYRKHQLIQRRPFYLYSIFFNPFIISLFRGSYPSLSLGPIIPPLPLFSDSLSLIFPLNRDWILCVIKIVYFILSGTGSYRHSSFSTCVLFFFLSGALFEGYYMVSQLFWSFGTFFYTIYEYIRGWVSSFGFFLTLNGLLSSGTDSLRLERKGLDSN